MFLLHPLLRDTDRSCTVIISGLKVGVNEERNEITKGKERRKEGKSFAKGC